MASEDQLFKGGSPISWFLYPCGGGMDPGQTLRETCTCIRVGFSWLWRKTSEAPVVLSHLLVADAENVHVLEWEP